MVTMKNTNGAQKTGPLNVAFYLRVSTDKQAQKEDGSLDTQLDRLTSFVDYRQKNGDHWAVTEKLFEGEKDGKRHGKSGKNTDRPAYQKLMALARAKLIDIVIVTRLDRISRNVADFLHLVAELERHDVRLISIRENIDLTSSAGRLISTVLMALAQYEREMIASRVKDKVAWRAERGFPLGPPPLGYVMKDKLYAIDEPVAAHVRAADALYLKRQSVDAVVQEFHRLGYRTPNGAVYNKPMISRILRNPTYAARIEYEGALHDAQWPAIRSRETHEQIQKILGRNARTNHSPKREWKQHVYILQGLLRCGVCGHKMTPKASTGRGGRPFPYYVCSGASKSAGVTCRQLYLPATMADAAVLEFMKQLHLKPEWIEKIARDANAEASDTVRKLREDLERVKTQLGAVRSKLSNMADAVAEGGRAALGSLKAKLEAMEAEREELEASEGKLKAELDAEASQEIVARDAIDALAQFHQLVATCEEAPDRIKLLLPRFVDYVVWHHAGGGEGRIEVALFQEPVASSADLALTGTVHSGGPRCAGGYQVVDLKGFEPSTS